MTGRNRPRPTGRVLDADRFDAVIFDLDGVVTNTATAHGAAWKRVFDSFLEKQSAQTGKPFAPFDEKRDYRTFVDGKPRYDGVRSFLHARGLALPDGSPGDSPERQTVCGLGNAKNRVFLQQIGTTGVESFPTTVRLIRDLKTRAKRVAVISSSRNCTAVLDAAGLRDLFEAQVDGIDSDRLKLAGKPAPDIFLAAANLLSTPPDRTAVAEDSIAGVAAARAGGFAFVIGVDRMDSPQDLYHAGADMVVTDLGELSMSDKGLVRRRKTSPLPDALARIDEILARIHARRPALFLDYDGTLTPIVDRPEDAALSDSMRAALNALVARLPVAIVSGRARRDVEALVDVAGIIFAGSHGFDVELPDGRRIEHKGAGGFKKAVAAAVADLRTSLADVPGVLIEDKTYDVAIHYRLAPRARRDEIEAAVDRAGAAQPALRKSGGKMVFELMPDIPWDKGRAVLWLLDALGLDDADVVPVYIGDDETDADAFRALTGRGISIFVEGDARVEGADYRLQSPEAAERFLLRLAASLTADTVG